MEEVPGAEVVTFPADVKDPIKAEEAVKVATSRFGRLDVVIANAAVLSAFDKRGYPTSVIVKYELIIVY